MLVYRYIDFWYDKQLSQLFELSLHFRHPSTAKGVLSTARDLATQPRLLTLNHVMSHYQYDALSRVES